MRPAIGISSATCIYGDATVAGALLDAAVACDVRMAVAAVPHITTDLFAEWLCHPAAATVAYLRRLAIEPASRVNRQPLALTWIFPASTGNEEYVARRAAVEALRGIVQSITREKASEWAPVNGLAAEAGDLESALETVRFFGEPSAAFTAGATFDLTRKLGRTL